jgi:hypothetical protein
MKQPRSRRRRDVTVPQGSRGRVAGGLGLNDHPRMQHRYVLVRSIGRLASMQQKRGWAKFKSTNFYRMFQRDWRIRIYTLSTLLLFIVSTIGTVIQPYLDIQPHTLSAEAKQLLPDPNERFGEMLVQDQKTGNFAFNDGYAGEIVDDSGTSRTGTPRFSASFSKLPHEGVTVTDTENKIDFTIKPKFKLAAGKKDANQLFYRLAKADGYLVYTSQVSGVKEDIILQSYKKDTVEHEFELVFNSSMEARLEADGSVGVYGTDLPIGGEVSTGSESDKELLEKARQKATKDKLLFTIPAPIVVGPGKKESTARSRFALEGTKLTIITENLKNADYPLSIDPSIYVATAQKLMRGNNETNLDFDVSNELIQKGKLTGARFNSWTSSLALPAARWNHGTAVAGGYIYAIGGSSGSTNVATVYWAKLNTTTGAIEATNPGAGACASWCNNASYDLPAARAGLSVVAYNGFIYAMGGLDGAGARSNVMYIAKIGLNGEPSLWHPTDTNKNNWVYWYQASNLSSERSYSGAVAYNNRMYLLGGQTNASTGGVTTVEYANINPMGTLSSWTSTGMVALPSARHGHSVQVYNDRMYLIGGNSSGTLQSAVHYIKLASDGTMSGSWTSTSSFTTARSSLGGNFSTIWGGYIYVAGGCSAVNGSGYCTSILSDVNLASINADGSITDWGSIAGVTSSRIGYGLVGWRNVLYGIGGCTAQNTSTGACTTTSTTANYGTINQDGDASTVSNSVSSGTAPCAASTWYDCDLPPEGNGNGEGGRMSGGTIVNNGYVYYMGGCTAVGSNSVCYTGNAGKAADTVSWSAIAADGSLTRPSVCSGGTKTYVGSWCVDNTNTLNGSTGLAAFGHAVFNNTIYAIGGTSGTEWQSNVWRTTTNADGSINAWTSQTFTSLDLGNAKGYQYVFARANPGSAGTYPANLYVLGGCSGVTSTDSGLDCSGTMYTEVYKCNITTSGALEEGNANDCTTSGQLQIDAEPGTGGSQGLGVMAGTVYANYVYLIGGQSPNESERGAIMYAKIDNSNNIVAVSGSVWTTSANTINPVRRRGIAFGYNGYLYALAGYNVSQGGSLNDLLLAKINVSDGSIGTFSTSQVTVNARWDLRAVVNNGYVYTLGGCSAGSPPASCTSMSGTVQTFQLYNNYSGSPKLYDNGNQFTTDRYGASAAIVNGYIYLAGGCTTATDCTTATTNVQYAAIGADGVVGTWASTSNVLPAARVHGQLEASGGTLYYIGGQDSTPTIQSTVYYATPVAGNVTSAWSTATNGLPAARTMGSATVWNNRIYYTGGNNTSSVAQTTIYASPTLASGGNITSAWTSTNMTGFNVARNGHVALAYANNLYILGGFDGTNYLTDVQYAQINSTTGEIGSWSYTSSLPQPIRQADGFAANGFIYLFGGRSASTTCTTNTYVAPISANTTIATGNNPTGVGGWYQTNILFSTARYGVAAAYDQGKAYLLGGACNGTLVTTTSKLQYSTLQSQPQIAKYSRMIDTDTDVFPTSWLLNGIDNSIGARWQSGYRTMNDTDGVATDCGTADMSTWGQDTNVGDTRLGIVNTYVPKDGSGNNTNCARYFYFTVSIDASQTFGYPEDVSRGPTIADLTLFFTNDPSKRLKSGKTFTGGEQQPLDTPCRRGASVVGDPNYNCPLP